MSDWNEQCLPKPSQAITVEDVHSISHKECNFMAELLVEKQLLAEVQLRKDMSASLQRQKEDIWNGVAALFDLVDLEMKRLENARQTLYVGMEVHTKVISELEDLVSEQRKMIDEQREMMQVMWNAPGMPGGQEAIEKAKESAAVFFAGE